MAKKERLDVDVAGRTVSVSSPTRVVWPEAGYTKLQLIEYYITVAEGALRGAGGRPNVLKRFVKGVGEAPFFQKRAPESRPEGMRSVVLSFPSGRTAEEIVPDHPADLVWMANLGCVDLNPHGIRADDLDHPDELRIDLDPVPGVEYAQILEVAEVVRAALDDFGLVGWPKTSGSRGVHVNVRIERRWGFEDVRAAALAFAREVERRAPSIATAKWWKEERHGVFLDYNQNAKDRTVASAYSVRPTPDARVSMPLTWDELLISDPRDFTLATVPTRYRERGDASAGIDDAVGSLEPLLELAARQRAEGQTDAPWPPHYEKGSDEPPRVQPSRRRRTPGPPEEPAGGPRRKPRFPLLTIARAKDKDEALAGLERWRARHPEAAQHLEDADILVDAMRGRYTTWTRIRVNLRHVPEALRPAAEPPDPDYDARVEWRRPGGDG
ncbi:MAG: DNA polymerase domain-containing protein [Sandaracinaceae bacterium]